MKQKYFTDEERKEAHRASCKRWRDKHKDEEDFKAAQREANAKFRSTKYGRAINLLKDYSRLDRKYNRGECTLTPEWIVQNIFSGQCCAHCGETDWRKLGCNRLDNNLPHTPSNIEPCCWECNRELEKPKKQVYQYSLDGLLVAIWPSTSECDRNGYNKGAVAACCRGDYGYKTYKGHRWSYEPL